MTINMLKKNNYSATDKAASIDRGWLGLEAGGVLLLIMVGTVLALILVASLFNKNDTSTELSNAQFIMNQTRGLLKSRGNYAFTSVTKMTGTLIQFGGIPAGMTINGNPQSGTATAVNVWGGDVMVAPEKVNGSANNKGFSVTYKNVPQEACVTLATKMSETSLVSELSIAGTNNIGGVSAEKAGAQCKADNGSAGANTLIFKSNN